MSEIEIIAAVFGFLSVACTIGRSFWLWPTGLVQVLLYIVVFRQSRLYADMVLHVLYVGLQVYGWWAWWKASRFQSTDSEKHVEVRRLSPVRLAIGVLATLGLTAVVSAVLTTWTDAASPIPDSFVAAASIVAQILLAKRYLENWGFWIAVDIVGIGLFASRGLMPTAVLYGLFLVMAVVGLATWWRALQNQTRSGPGP